MTPSWRKPVGMLLILAIIVVWAALVASLSGMVGRWPWPGQLAFYGVAGIVWIAPLKPLLRWMETGRFG
ncbi:MAG TPA: DUF2842 domain-containing protein [Sphingomonas sp.]|nr:DUF2842 domain-containing protein [Sphingomonas sp.]